MKLEALCTYCISSLKCQTCCRAQLGKGGHQTLQANCTRYSINNDLMFNYSFNRSICIKDQVSDCLAQLQQLQEGLNSCNILDVVRNQPQVWEPVFVASNIFKISADEFLDQLEPQYSNSQAMKSKEVDTFKFFNDVIEKFEVGNITFPVLVFIVSFDVFLFQIYVIV